MPTNDGADDRDRIKRIREAWERFDNTGDVTAIADHLAEDVVLMPPGAPPITGKAAVIEGANGGSDFDINQTSENLLISGDLAVDRITVTGTRDSVAGDDSDHWTLKGVDIYQREAIGAWKCIIAIWNNQV